MNNRDFQAEKWNAMRAFFREECGAGEIRQASMALATEVSNEM